MEKFTARNLANTLWAMAKINLDPGVEVLAALSKEAAEKMADFNAQNIANSLWAFAILGKLLSLCCQALGHQSSKLPSCLCVTDLSYSRGTFLFSTACVKQGFSCEQKD